MIFHNLAGYDAHLFIKELSGYGLEQENENITCIPNNEEKYISFSKNIIVDSFKQCEPKIAGFKYEENFN